jgi:hypothetical protein
MTPTLRRFSREAPFDSRIPWAALAPLVSSTVARTPLAEADAALPYRARVTPGPAAARA